jgi:SPP1 family phage portal protein
MIITDTELAIAEITKNSGMTLEEIIKAEVDLWVGGATDESGAPETGGAAARLRMIEGDAYYRGKDDILRTKTQRIKKRSNVKRVHPYIRKLTDQKVGYLFSNQFEVTTQNSKYQDLLDGIVTQQFQRLVMNTGKDAIKCGIAWWQPYFAQDGTLAFKKLRPWEVKPLWADDEHENLNGFIRVWDREEYVSRQRERVRYVTYADDREFRHYRYKYGQLTPLGTEPHFKIDGKSWAWNRVPLICWKNNDEEQGMVELIKSLVDDYDLQASKHSDLLADLSQVIYALRGYGGQSLDGFVQSMQKYMAVKLDADQGAGIDQLTTDPDASAVEQLLQRTRQNLYEFGRGVDTQNEDLGNASGQAIRFRYGDLDMDCSILEQEFQWAFEQVEWFIKSYLKFSGQGDYTKEDAQVVFHRDVIINEKEIVDICVASKGIISDQTIREHHPWRAEDEDERIEKQDEESLERAKDYQNAFAAKKDDGSNDGEDDKAKGDSSGSGSGKDPDDDKSKNQNNRSGGGADNKVHDEPDTLNGAQTQALISVIMQYKNGTLTLQQAVNIISISIGVSEAVASRIVQGRKGVKED